MTIIIISPAEQQVAWVEPTTEALRKRGLRVVRLGSLSIIGFLLLSEKIAGVLVHEDSLPSDWDVVRARMARLAPASKIVVVARDERRSPGDLAALVAP